MGSRIGTLKVAADRLGMSFDEYMAKRNAGLKWCWRCCSWKPPHDFGFNKLKGDGLSAVCFQCVRYKYCKTMKGGPPNGKIGSQAASAISWEVKKGRMLPATALPCRDCGGQAEQYHHHLGYNREHWLDVIPLCVSCHRYRHFSES